MRAKILNASAGSGKTYQLAYKYVHDVIEQPDMYRHILAVTFTNKATEEMKTRILKEIHALASGGESPYMNALCNDLWLDAHTVRKRAAEARAKILHDYSRFTVLTIDTFFQRILRAFIKELGIDLNYNVEIETSSVLAKSAETLIEQITVDRDLQRWLTEFVQERIDEGKKWDIRDGILSLGSELFKEKNKDALSLAHSKEELSRIVARAASNTEKTKQQIQQTAQRAVDIITNAGCSANDFTGKSRSFVNYFYVIAGGTLKAYSATVGKMSRTTEGWCGKTSAVLPLVSELQPLLCEVCDLYDTNIRAWNTYDLLRENYRSFALLADLYARIQQLCDEQNMMLLSETKYILSAFIGHNDAPFIYEKVGNRFDRFMIDEFQDTSVKEWENFLPLLDNAMAQSDKTSVLIVGDIKQSIYRWRGGDWKILHSGAQQALGMEQTEVVNLKENWRSLPAIVDFNNRLIGRIVSEDNRMLNTQIDSAVEIEAMAPDEGAALHDTLADAYREHEQIPRRKGDHPGYVSVATFDEKPPVVECICSLLDKGFRPCDMLILVRSASEGVKVAAELLDFKQQNTEERYRFDVMTQEALIVGNAPVCTFIAAALRLALNAADSISRAVCNHYLGRAFDDALTDDEKTFFRSIRLLSPEEAFERIIIRYNLQQNRLQTAYMQAMHEQIIAFCTNKVADIELFLKWWDEQGAGRSLSVEQSATTVEITTIHKAKGLEKPAVIIPYCSWELDPKSGGNVTNIIWAESHGTDADALGRFPVKYKNAMAESGFSAEYYREKVFAHVDNINLLYVALTRAAESLHIFIPQNGRSFHIDGLIRQSIEIDGEEAVLGETRGSYTANENENGIRFSFGEFAGPSAGGGKRSEATHITLEGYPTAHAEMRLRLPSQRYFEEGDTELAPRNFGILMHKAFENADNEAQIDRAVTEMSAAGMLTAAEADTLRQMIAQALDQPMAREWFGGDWQRVRNEHEIIVPNSTTRRPDRVMIRGNRAVVVDYKFGTHDAERYRRQIREYMRLLREMGYSQTEGYLWYVKLGRIEAINN